MVSFNKRGGMNTLKDERYVHGGGDQLWKKTESIETLKSYCIRPLTLSTLQL